MDILSREIAAPVLVMVGGAYHIIAYPMHAVILYKQRTGDSLFQAESWKRIDLENDPERWLSCLWAGLHQRQADGAWRSPYSYDDLAGLVHFGNAGEISQAMVKALIAFMPKAETPPPNVPPPVMEMYAADLPADPILPVTR